jgi:glucosyl-3-phosphoglycerate phosphatase
MATITLQELLARVGAKLQRVQVQQSMSSLGDKENQLIVVATHGGTARCLIGHYLHLPMAHWGKIGGLSNARWSILQTSPKGWHLAEHNAGSILEPVFGEESGADVPDHVR